MASVAGLNLITAGSVSIDESLNLSLVTNIPESWVAEIQWLDDLANEKLQFEIEGSLSSPSLNDAELARLVERLGTKLVLESVVDVAEKPMLDLLGL
jgi:hypothetical protein